MSEKTNLWWAYDSENGSFATLPAGPFLLPALGIFAFVAIAKALKHQNKKPEAAAGRLVVKSDWYQTDKARFQYLVNKKIQESLGNSDGLSVAEAEELQSLSHPKWNKGRPWYNW